MHLVETGKGLLTAAKTAADAQKAVTHATTAAKDAGSKIAASAKSAAAAVGAQAEALLGGRQPVWLHPSFREEVLGQSLVHEAQPSAPELSAVLGSMALIVAQLQSLRGSGGGSPALAAAAAAVHESFLQSLSACQHGQSAVWTVLQPGSCASSGRA